MTLLNQRYRKLQNLSAGGFGDTFLAEDTQIPSARKCVIKRLRPINHNPEFYQLIQQRFQREAAILERLGQHPQVPALYAYFEEDNQFYLVQEWVPGITLHQLIRQHKALSSDFVVPFSIHLLQVLDFVHRHQIIHRDIKPANIILRQTDNLPVLIDFGAVKEILSGLVNPNGQGSQTIIIGTPGYIAPEQVQGNPCFASDLYSLGYTLIYALTGNDPQSLPVNLHTGELEWHSHNQNLQTTLVEIIERSIALNLSHRFSSALDMQQALMTVPLTGSPPISSMTPTIAIAPEQITPELIKQKPFWLPRWVFSFGILSFLVGAALAAALITLRNQQTVLPPSPEPPQEDIEPQPSADSLDPSDNEDTLSPSPSPFDPQLSPGDISRTIDVENDDFLAILNNAGIQNKIIGCLPYNAQNIQITGKGKTLNQAVWYPVQYQNIQGWVSGRYLARQSQSSGRSLSTSPPRRSINGPRDVINISANDNEPVLFILDQPGTRNERGNLNTIIGCIPFDGTNIYVTDTAIASGQSSWAKVWYRGVEGWVNSRYLSQR